MATPVQSYSIGNAGQTNTPSSYSTGDTSAAAIASRNATTPAQSGATDYNNANQSTTTLSSQNKVDQVPAIQSTTAKLADTGVKTDTTTGISTNANGTPYTPPVPPTT